MTVFELKKVLDRIPVTHKVRICVIQKLNGDHYVLPETEEAPQKNLIANAEAAIYGPQERGSDLAIFRHYWSEVYKKSLNGRPRRWNSDDYDTLDELVRIYGLHDLMCYTYWFFQIHSKDKTEWPFNQKYPKLTLNVFKSCLDGYRNANVKEREIEKWRTATMVIRKFMEKLKKDRPDMFQSKS